MAEKKIHTNRPIYIIGAGGIVNAAHLPAYAIAGYPVAGIYDIDKTKAAKTANDFTIPEVYDSLQQMLENAPSNAVFDIAVPGSAIAAILNQLPAQSALLMQKPMGEDLASAKKILEICRQKQMTAAVNFQLRYAPFIKQARRMIDDGILGEIFDIEVNVNVFTPWHLWDFLFTAPRMEIVYHSIHYIDLVRSFLGNPTSIYAKTIQHPAMMELASVRSNIIMDYGMQKRANILTNHCHVYGKQRQQSYIKIEGSKGAIKIHFGVLKNYPEGESDRFEYILMEDGKYNSWKTKTIKGSWFPHAFMGSMEQVLLAADGKIQQPDNSVEDCIHTMACVEAAYISSEQGGVRPDELIRN